jgi:DNA-binding NarL/FixJ family response regulator
MTVRLLLVISSPTTSDSIRGALRNDQTFGPVAEIFEAHEDIHRCIAQLSPDVIIIDRDLPGADGIALADEVLRTHPQIAPALILLADAYHQGDAVRAARAGVRGYLLKDQEAWLLCAAIRAVASGAGWLSPAAAGELLGELRDSITLRPYRLQPGLDRLTQRERSVIRLVALGYSNIEIAGQLMLGASTIRTHVSRMLAKLDLRTRAQLAAIAGKNGLE